ncbi:hypothetical protein WJX72_004251 [[Myrmecia] bisecta]|uniref:Uncharacterized protein n=1 Tax=[Myrmecia] bisecta TaxID=41462 RepID=A0AAW1Q3R4_9CHLO
MHTNMSPGGIMGQPNTFRLTVLACLVLLVAGSCSDNVMDGRETDINCGGNCGKCVDGKKCKINNDCISDICDRNVCVSCNDAAKNGAETDVDCARRFAREGKWTAVRRSAAWIP